PAQRRGPPPPRRAPPPAPRRGVPLPRTSRRPRAARPARAPGACPATRPSRGGAPDPRRAPARPRLPTNRRARPPSTRGLPRHRPREQDVAPERAPEYLLRRTRGRDQRAQVDPGRDAHLMEHRYQVLGRDVPGRPRRHRAAAELAEARLEALDAR